MSALVLKEWKADSSAIDSDGNLVRIVGRKAGLIAWFLALLKIDPTTSVLVSPNRVEFIASSLAGTDHRVIPVRQISSTYYGYYKPWKMAIVIFVVVGWLAGLLFGGSDPSLISNSSAIIMGALVALIYYQLSRTMTLGFVEVSGVVSAIQFKQSVIEGVEINAKSAEYVCDLAQFLIDAKG